MGLDITAYSGISKIDCALDGDGEPIDPATKDRLDYGSYARLYINDDFPGRAGDVQDGGFYRYRDAIDVRGGAYSAYNRWRESLAKIAGWPRGEIEQYGRMRESHCVECWDGAEGAFSELINFSDCEGTIGGAVSKKLAADFAAHQGRVDQHNDPEFANKYAEFRAAFDLASDDGCVVFH